MENNIKHKKIEKNIKLLMIFNFFNYFRLYNALSIIYFTEVTGSIAKGMSIFAVMTITTAFSELPTGIISDMLGRKRTIVVGSIFFALAITFYAIGISYFVLIIGAILEGIAMSFFSGNNEALLYDTLVDLNKENEYKTYLGKINAMFQVGLAVSAIVGGIIAIWSMKYTLWLSVIPQIICVFIAALMVNPSIKHESKNAFEHFKESFKEFISNKKIRQISLANAVDYAVGQSGYDMSATFINLLWPVWAIGIYKMLTNVFGTISFWFSGKIIDRFKHRKSLVGVNIFSAVLNLTAFTIKSVISPVLISFCSLGFGVYVTTVSDIKQSYFSSKYRATMGSIDSLIRSILFGIMAIVFGFIAEKIGIIYSFIIIQFAVLGVTFVYARILKEKED